MIEDCNSLMFGRGGHEGEYCLNVLGYNIQNFIPPTIGNQLQQLLPGWDVDVRGARIEIVSKIFYGYRNDPAVLAAVEKVVGKTQLIGDVAELKKFRLPMILVLDEDHYNDTGELRFVKCAVLVDNPHDWRVKPVEPPYFDSRQWAPVNTAFHQAWWGISKNDTSAELLDETFDISVVPLISLTAIGHVLSNLYSEMRHPDRGKVAV